MWLLVSTLCVVGSLPPTLQFFREVQVVSDLGLVSCLLL